MSVGESAAIHTLQSFQAISSEYSVSRPEPMPSAEITSYQPIGRSLRLREMNRRCTPAMPAGIIKHVRAVRFTGGSNRLIIAAPGQL